RFPPAVRPRPASGAAADWPGAAPLPDDLSDLLREFDEVIEDFDRGPACQYEQHLEDLKRKAGHSVYDSGIDELESESKETWRGTVMLSGWNGTESTGVLLRQTLAPSWL
uniref:RGCC protein n=1 Tax=Nothoprocta perdicaria TaxID=30464 RepID=A0A8C7E9U9_NOTPE